MTILLNNGEKYITDNPHTDDLRETLLLKGIEIRDKNDSSLSQTIPALALVISIVFIIVIAVKKGNFGKASVTNIEIEDYSKNKTTALNFYYAPFLMSK